MRKTKTLLLHPTESSDMANQLFPKLNERWGYLRASLMAKTLILKLVNKLAILVVLYGLMVRVDAGFGEWIAFWAAMASAVVIWFLDHVLDVDGSGG